MTAPTATDLRPLINPWTSALAQRSKDTARSYDTVIRRFLSTTTEVTPDAIGEYLDSLSDLAPASRAHHISAVRSFLQHAQKMGVMEQTPLDLLVRPRVTITSFNRYLTVEELRALIVSARELSPRHYATALLLAGCGLRVSEAASATWRDIFVDPDGRLGLRVIGKGQKERIVKVRQDVFDALVVLHGSAELDARDKSPILPSPRGGSYSQYTLWRFITDAARKAEIQKPVSPHWLRHTHATLAARGGASALVIQAALGHSHLETSQRYIHMAKGLADTTADYLPEMT